MDALTALPPWWLLASLVYLALGGLCVVLALRPCRRAETACGQV